MKKRILPLVLAATTGIISCNKNDGIDNSNIPDLLTTEQTVTQNFGQDIAYATYADLMAAGITLNSSVQALVDTPNAAKLETAKTNWRNMRAIWEQSEGFLFGPVEDNNYDPITDTWPTDLNEMDSLLADNSNALNITDIQQLPYSLRGYHPLEYMLWGKNSNKAVADFTPRQMQYMKNLALDIQSQVTDNYIAWSTGYVTQVTTAGAGSTQFSTYYNLFYTMTEGMIGICNEVGKSDEGSGKIWEPFSANNMTGDSTLVESPYSENSMADFKNNIVGAYYVYIGKYRTQEKGLSDIVQLYDKNLDNQIKAKFTAAISSFDLVNVSFEKAIYTQRDQLQSIINAIGAVRDILNDQLHPFLQQHISN